MWFKALKTLKVEVFSFWKPCLLPSHGITYKMEWRSFLCTGELLYSVLSLDQLPYIYLLCFLCHEISSTSPLKWLFAWHHFLSDVFILFITNTYIHIKYLLIIISSCLNQPLESRCKFYGNLLFCSINFKTEHSINQFMPPFETIKLAFTGNKSLLFHSLVIIFLNKNMATNINTYLNACQTNFL